MKIYLMPKEGTTERDEGEVESVKRTVHGDVMIELASGTLLFLDEMESMELGDQLVDPDALEAEGAWITVT